MKSICALIAMILIFGLAAVADGLMNAYGITVFVVVSAITLAVAWILVEISNSTNRGR